MTTNSPDSYVAWDGTRRPWHYEVKHPTDASCYDCQRPYSAIGDCSVDYEVWKQIAPTSHGGGILCPNCMLERLHALGLSNVPAILW